MILESACEPVGVASQEKTRKAIERKLEETAAEEKEAVAQEKRELFQKIKSVKMRVGRIRSHLQMVEEVGCPTTRPNLRAPPLSADGGVEPTLSQASGLHPHTQ